METLTTALAGLFLAGYHYYSEYGVIVKLSDEKCTENLLPMLRGFCLYDRITISLVLLGRNNDQIAQLF